MNLVGYLGWVFGVVIFVSDWDGYRWNGRYHQLKVERVPQIECSKSKNALPGQGGEENLNKKVPDIWLKMVAGNRRALRSLRNECSTSSRTALSW